MAEIWPMRIVMLCFLLARVGRLEPAGAPAPDLVPAPFPAPAPARARAPAPGPAPNAASGSAD